MNGSGSVCVFCRVAPAEDPWSTCLACMGKIPEPFRPPVLSPAGRRICLELRQRMLSEACPISEMQDAPEPRHPANPLLTGIPVPGIGIVGVASSTSARVRAAQRWASRRRR